MRYTVRLAGYAGWLVLLGAMFAACPGERARPGPPTISLEVREGGTVFSPDTLPVVVRATDPNGIETLTVRLLDEVREPETDLRREVIAVVQLAVPGGLPPGSEIEILAHATDLTGQTASTRDTVTVIARP